MERRRRGWRRALTLVAGAVALGGGRAAAPLAVDLTRAPYVLDGTGFEGDLDRYRLLLPPSRQALYREVTDDALARAWKARFPGAERATGGDAVRVRVVAVIPTLDLWQLLRITSLDLKVRLQVRWASCTSQVSVEGALSGAALNADGVTTTREGVAALVRRLPDTLTLPGCD